MTDLREGLGADVASPPLPPTRSAGRAWARSATLVAACALFTVALRTPFLTWPVMPDEAGLLIIAGDWHEGPFLYGDYFVGRGVVLMLLYALADALGGAFALRLLGCVVAVTLVVAAGWAGHLLRGSRGAGWAAVVAASYASTYAFSAQVMNGRLVAACLVMVSCACTIAAVRRARPREHGGALLWAGLAGTAATCALLVVQSYAGGAVFAAVLLLASWRARALARSAALRIGSAGLVGLLVPVAALGAVVVLAWPTAEQVWFQMFGYRLGAAELVGGSNDMDRLAQLVVVAGLTGVLLLLVGLAGGYRSLRRTELGPFWVAVVVMLGVDVVGMALGGAFYPDYLLQLVPEVVLGAALVAPSSTWSGLGTKVGALVAVVAALCAVYFGLQRPVLGTSTNEGAVGQWLSAAARPGDEAVVLWGKASVLYEADLTTDYPYLWSLLTRTLDSDLSLLLSELRGDDPPVWVVEWYDPDSWGLDESGRLADVIADRYVYAGRPCGVDVYRLRTAERQAPPSRRCDELRQ